AAMAAISSGQVIACLLSLRTRAAASNALRWAGLPAGVGSVAGAGSLAAAGRGAAVCAGGAGLAGLLGVALRAVLFLASLMLLGCHDASPLDKTANRAVRLPRCPIRVSTVTSPGAPVQGHCEAKAAFSARSGLSPGVAGAARRGSRGFILSSSGRGACGLAAL